MSTHEAATACEAAMDNLVEKLDAYLAIRGGAFEAHADVKNWLLWRLSAPCAAIEAPGYPHRPLADL